VLSAIAFCTLAAALLTVVPGPDNALLLRNALRGGGSYAMATAAGCAIGLVCWGLIAAFGLTAGRVGYNVLRVAGAVYLVALGVGMWRRAGAVAPVSPGRQRGGTSILTGFRLGLATDLLNPKAAVFFVSFLPQFIPAGSNVFAMTVLYGFIQALLMVIWGVLVIALVQQLRRLLTSATVRRRMERVTATAMVGFGLRLALSRPVARAGRSRASILYGRIMGLEPRGGPAQAFHVVAPSLPGLGFSQFPEPPDQTPWSIARIARTWAELPRAGAHRCRARSRGVFRHLQ
jgi:threonine/homoserine/homoserine lactone efflux protein